MLNMYTCNQNYIESEMKVVIFCFYIKLSFPIKKNVSLFDKASGMVNEDANEFPSR